MLYKPTIKPLRPYARVRTETELGAIQAREARRGGVGLRSVALIASDARFRGPRGDLRQRGNGPRVRRVGMFIVNPGSRHRGVAAGQ